MNLCFLDHFPQRKCLRNHKRQFVSPYICRPLGGRNVLRLHQSGRNGNNVHTTEFAATSTPRPASCFPSRGPRGEAGTPRGRAARPWVAGRGARPPSTFVSGGPAPTPAPARGTERVTHPSLAKSGRGRAGGGEGKESLAERRDSQFFQSAGIGFPAKLSC